MSDMYRIIPRASGMMQSIVNILHVHHQKLLAKYLSWWCYEVCLSQQHEDGNVPTTFWAGQNTRRFAAKLFVNWVNIRTNIAEANIVHASNTMEKDNWEWDCQRDTCVSIRSRIFEVLQ